MAKTIKFNLICDQKPVRTIEDLQQNFSIEDILAYYHNGLLIRWLKVRGYAEELKKVTAIVETEDIGIIKKLIEIFGVVTDYQSVEEDIYILKYLEEQKELRGVQKVREKVTTVVETVLSKAVDTATSVVSSVFDFCSSIFSW